MAAIVDVGLEFESPWLSVSLLSRLPVFPDNPVDKRSEKSIFLRGLPYLHLEPCGCDINSLGRFRTHRHLLSWI
jgi:hypothetical protein